MNNVVTIDVTASSGENIRKNFEKATASITKFDNALKRMEEHIKKMALKDYEINIAFRVQNINNLWRDIVKQPFQRWWSTSGSNYLLNEGLNIGTAIGSEISSNITEAIDLGLKNISNSIKKIPNYTAINAEGNQVMNTAYNVKRYTDGLSVFNDILKYQYRGGQLLSIQGLISSSKQYLPALGALTAFSTVESAMSDLTASFGKNDKYEKFMYQVVAAGKVAGVVTGALIGKAIGATFGFLLGPVGALMGAGIGGYLGMVSGERVKERELLKREQSRYASADLRNALADNVGDEEFKRKFNQIVTKDLKGRFSTYKLPLKEIENIAQNITMDNQVKEFERFAMAASEAENSLNNLNSLNSTLEKIEWEIDLKPNLSLEEKELYINATQELIKEAEQYVQDQYYETASAMELLIGKNERSKKIIENTKPYYDSVSYKIGEYEQELQGEIFDAENTERKVDLNKVRNIRQGASNIVNEMGNIDLESGYEAVLAKYGGSKSMNAESFQKLMMETEKLNETAIEAYDKALFTAVNVIEKAKDTNPNYYTDKKTAKESYKSQIEGLRSRTEDFYLQIIIDAYDKRLESMIPVQRMRDADYNIQEVLKTMIHEALKKEVDFSQVSDDNYEPLAKELGFIDYLEEMRPLMEMIQILALSLPKEDYEKYQTGEITALPDFTLDKEATASELLYINEQLDLLKEQYLEDPIYVKKISFMRCTHL